MRTNKGGKPITPLAQALKLLTVRPRSVWELKQLLLERKYSEEEIEPVISHLIHLGYLDDLKFMESWCYYRQHISPKGRWYVRRELALKGISSCLLESHFNHFYSEEDELHCLKRLLEKKLGKKKAAESHHNEKDTEKIIAALVRKGFRHSAVLDMFSQLGAKHLDN